MYTQQLLILVAVLIISRHFFKYDAFVVIVIYMKIKKKKIAKRIIKQLKKMYPNAKISLKYKNNWELLVAVILSAQCTDKKVNEVTAKLFRKYKKLDDYVNAKVGKFEKDVYSTGFYRNKTRNILASAKLIKNKFHGRVPNTMEKILGLPGVSRKTANVVLGNAYGIVEGIVVDTHVIRLSRRLGLTNEKDPKKIERELMQIIPQEEWFNFSIMLIYYGREYCTAKSHNHEKCPIE